MFKRFLLFILISLMLAIGSHAYAATNFFGAITLTGGTSGALDDIDGDDLTNGDICYVVTSTDFYVYYLNATSGAGESSPDIISPDDNAGNKRWELIFLGDAEMADMAQLAVTDGNFIVGNNTTWVAESGNTARTSLGLGTGNSPTFVTNDLTGITDYNIPYMQPAGAGFGDSPLWTDGTDVELGADDSTKHFDVHSAGTIKMRDASDDTLVTIGPVADGTTILGIIGSLNPSGDVYIADDKKIYLGSDQDFSMEYDEDGNDSASFDGADINYNGYYAVGLQNIPDLASRGPSYWFDGVDDYVSLADDADLNPGTGDIRGVCNKKVLGMMGVMFTFLTRKKLVQ